MINDLNLNANLYWITYNEFIKYQKKIINGKDYKRKNFQKDKLIEFINCSEDLIDIKKEESYDNDRVKSNDLMELSNNSIYNSENREKEEEEIILENNDIINKDKYNNLIESFENIKIDDNNEHYNESNNNASNSIGEYLLDIENKNLFKKTLKERLSD